MDPNRWKKVKPLLEEAMDLEPAERKLFLVETSAGDEELLRDAEGLLDYQDPASDPLEVPAYNELLAALPRSMAGEQIGNYKLIEELGAGGMGTVYLAERADGQFRQKVALKLIKRGMDSDAIVRRFVHERQILASLEHPFIARLIDGGTTTAGLPFFVMEYVEAETVLEYAARNELGLEDRLELFRKVCSAVSFAHQNLVVHRDLKPSNILVTGDGTPKLLDFGIAKLLKADPKDAVTATQNYVFTPEYASPEQVRGENLTTATDVYSLGVILYELLTAGRPYKTEGSNISDIIRIVCETEPTPPSRAAGEKGKSKREEEKRRRGKEGKETVRPNVPSSPPPLFSSSLLKGDLDNIILKALRKESERRYTSVEQLSEDIRRHLEGLPVTASADTFWYRTSKYVQRNRIAVAAAGLILLTLIAGLGATLYQANVARRERERAEQRFNDVRQLANSFMFEINDEIKKSPIKARGLLAERAVEYLDKLAADAVNDRGLQSELATGYEKIGDLQSALFNPNLGKTSDALASHRKSLGLRQELYSAEPTAERALEVAVSHIKVGDILTMSGQIAETRENYETAIQILDGFHAADANNYKVRHKLATALSRLGQAILRSGSLVEALHAYERSLEIYQQLHSENPDNPAIERMVGVLFSYIGFVRYEMAEPDEAVACYGKWLVIEEKLNMVDPNDHFSLENLGTAHTWFGIVLDERSSSDEAIFHLREGLKLQEKLFNADRDNFGARMSFADAQLELAKVLAKGDSSTEVIKLLEDAIGHYTAIWQKDSESRWTRRRIAFSQRYLAGALAQRGDRKKALEMYREALATFKELTAADPDYSEWSWDLATCYLRMGEFFLKQKDKTSALSSFELARPIFEKLSADSPENIHRRRELEMVNTYLDQLRGAGA